jgi:quercetin dioxygenase-like cupin family protein
VRGPRFPVNPFRTAVAPDGEADHTEPDTGEEQPVFAIHSPDDHETPALGVRMKTLCHGRTTLMTEFRLAGGSTLPAHSHPHEQTGYLVSGHLVLTIGEETHDVMPGDSWCIPGGVRHDAAVLQDSVAVEVFSPVREDYLPEGTRKA